MKGQIIIKRYPNRKLYDTSQCLFVNLTELDQIINEGYQIKVIDNKTGNDITVKTKLAIQYQKDLKNL